MSEQGKRVQRRKQEDEVFNKMLTWLAGAVIVELLSLLVRRMYINFKLTDVGVAVAYGISKFFMVYRFVGIVLVAAGLVWLFMSWKKNGKLLVPLVATGVVLWLWLAAFLCYTYQAAGAVVLCVIPAVFAAYVVVYFLYQHEFFCNTVLGGLGIIALVVFRKIYMNHPRMTLCGFAVVWLLMVLAVLAVIKLSRNNGKLGSFSVFPPETAYLPMYITCAVVAVVLAAALFLGISAAYYLIGVLAAWLFCLAVYYTVKLM